jgi:hypothetical protein
VISISESEFLLAFNFVSFDAPGTNQAWLCPHTGRIRLVSAYDDSIDEEDIMEEDFEEKADKEDWVELPHKVDLDLGKNLVFRFVAQYLPSDDERVRDFFRRRGAYARYKDLLELRGALAKWHQFEEAETRRVLLDWCERNGIRLRAEEEDDVCPPPNGGHPL